MKIWTRIALRYIVTKRALNFITVISIISIIGIVVGVASLISVISIFNGFREFTEKQLIGHDPHLRITASEGAWLSDSENILNKINSIDKIASSVAYIRGRTIAVNATNMQVFNLFAVKPEEFYNVSGIYNSIIAGSFYLRNNNNLNGIVIGAGIADRLKILPGDTILLTSPKMIESSIKSFRKQKPIPVIVTGIFQTNTKNYDNTNAYVNELIGKKLFKPEKNAISLIDIKLKDIDDLEEVKLILANFISDDAEILTWYDLHKDLFSIMNFERILAYVIMSLIIIIAVFNVLASLSMTVVEKKRDIGVLKAMGASNKIIQKIFMRQGLYIGVFSTSLGIMLGLGFCFGQIKFKWFTLDGANFLIDSIPVSVYTWDIIFIALITLILSFAASIFPAKRASSTSVIKAVQSE